MYSSEKEMYETPTVQVVELAAENAICIGSSEPNAQGHGFEGGWY